MNTSNRTVIGILMSVVIVPCSGCSLPPIEMLAFPDSLPLPIDPSYVGLTFEEFQATNAQGEKIAGWWIPAEDAVGTVIFSTGTGGSMPVDWQAYSTTLTLAHNLNYNVVNYDGPGYGNSEGQRTFSGLVPSLKAVIDYTRQREAAGSDRIVLMGHSMGTLVSLAVAAEKPESVVGLILVGTGELSTPSPANAQLEFLYGVSEMLREARLVPLENVPLIDVPLLMLHSVHDLVCPIAGARLVFEAAPEPKTFVELDGDGFSGLAPDVYPAHSMYQADNGVNFSDPIRTFLLDLAP